MVRLIESPYFKRVIGLLLVAVAVGCSSKGNSDSPAPEGDLSPSAPASLSLSGVPTVNCTPTFTWAASTPQNGTISSYWVSIGTTPGAEDIMSFTDVGNITSYQFTTGSFSLGINYYFSVYSIDSNERSSTTVTSDPWNLNLVRTNDALHEPEAPYFLASCADYLSSPYYDGESSDNYWIDPDGVGGNSEFRVYCDQATDGGGWHLVVNYIHQGGTDPLHNLMSSSLPLMGSASLGDDGSSDSTSWGHATTAMANNLSPTETRFYCTSSLHGKIIHFKTSHSPSLAYLTSGIGRMLGLPSSFTAYPDHTANLPGTATSFGKDLGDDAMIRFPFVVSGSEHWSAGFGSRWECDDFAFNDANDTIHQVWMR